MSPSEFTLDFYLTCLSQAKWHSDDPVDVRGVELMKKVALERKGEFEKAYEKARDVACLGINALVRARNPFELHKHFPVATPANEPQNQNNKHTTMNTLLKESYDSLIKPVVEVLNRIANVMEANSAVVPQGLANETAEAPTTETPATEEAPKKRRKKAEEPAPEPEPEPPAKEEPYMSGDELVALMEPLRTTDFSKKLVEFREQVLKSKLKTRDMTDPAMLRAMEAKIREFLAANEADQQEP